MGYDLKDLTKLKFEDWKAQHPNREDHQFQRYLAKFEIRLNEVKAERQRMIRLVAARPKPRQATPEAQVIITNSKLSFPLVRRRQQQELAELTRIEQKTQILMEKFQRASEVQHHASQRSKSRTVGRLSPDFLSDDARSLSVQRREQLKDEQLQKRREEAKRQIEEQRRRSKAKSVRHEELIRSYQDELESFVVKESERTLSKLKKSEETRAYLYETKAESLDRQRKLYLARREAVARKNAEKRQSFEARSLQGSDYHSKVERAMQELADDTAFRKEQNELRFVHKDLAMHKLEEKRKRKVELLLQKFENSKKRIESVKTMKLKSIAQRRERELEKFEEFEEGRRRVERMQEYRTEQAKNRLKAAEAKALKIEKERAQKLQEHATIREKESQVMQQMNSRVERLKAKKLRFLSLSGLADVEHNLSLS
jgi:hypothetical protein